MGLYNIEKLTLNNIYLVKKKYREGTMKRDFIKFLKRSEI